MELTRPIGMVDETLRSVRIRCITDGEAIYRLRQGTDSLEKGDLIIRVFYMEIVRFIQGFLTALTGKLANTASTNRIPWLLQCFYLN